MPTEREMEDQARQQAREVLSKQPNFSQLDREQQFEQYKNLVSTLYNQLVEQERAKEIQSLDGQLTAQQSFSGAMAASDLINDDRHLNRRIDQQGEIAGNVLREVDFPKFVKDLLKSVFDANLQVTKDQMNSYAELVERITKPAAQLIDTIDDRAAKMFLAENYSDKYKLSFGDDDLNFTDEGNGQQDSNLMKLATVDGSPLEEADLRGAIMQAKLELVGQHQRLLEEMLLMGVTRMVVDNGKIKASIDFSITAKDNIKKGDAANERSKKQKVSSTSRTSHSFWYGDSSTEANSDVQTNIAISTAKVGSQSTTDSSTKVKGEVEINFKSDYFKLDNFKDILQPSGQRNQDKKSPGGSNADGQASESAETVS